jgi:hypothetical protein
VQNNESISDLNDDLTKEVSNFLNQIMSDDLIRLHSALQNGELKQANGALVSELKAIKAAQAKLGNTDKDHLLTTIDRLEAEATARDIRVEALEHQLNIQAMESSRKIAELQLKLFESEIDANLYGSGNSPDSHSSRHDRDYYRDRHHHRDDNDHSRSPRNSRSGEREDRDYDDRRRSRRSSRRYSSSPRGGSYNHEGSKHSPRDGNNYVFDGNAKEPTAEPQNDSQFQADVANAVAASLSTLNAIPENTKTLSNSTSKSSIGESVTGKPPATSVTAPITGDDGPTANAVTNNSTPGSKPTSRPVSRPGSKGSVASTAGSGLNAVKELRVTTEGETNEFH